MDMDQQQVKQQDTLQQDTLIAAHHSSHPVTLPCDTLTQLLITAHSCSSQLITGLLALSTFRPQINFFAYFPG